MCRRESRIDTDARRARLARWEKRTESTSAEEGPPRKRKAKLERERIGNGVEKVRWVKPRVAVRR